MQPKKPGQMKEKPNGLPTRKNDTTIVSNPSTTTQGNNTKTHTFDKNVFNSGQLQTESSPTNKNATQD